MRHGRMLAHLVPLLAAAGVPGLIALLYSPQDVGRKVLVGPGRYLGWAFIVVYCGVALLFWQDAVRRPPLPMAVTADSADLLVAIGPAWCGEDRALVASPDVGALLHRHPQAQTLDLGALTDPDDARSASPSWWPTRIEAVHPQVVLVHGPWVPRTGLYPDVMARLGYHPTCVRHGTPGPQEGRYPPTLYRRQDCARPLTDALTARLADWCARPR